MNANNTFSLVTRTIAVCEHPLVKRGNFSYQLYQPFSWSLVNTAAQLLKATEPETRDRLRVKCATMRHWNRMIDNNDVGISTVQSVLKTRDSDEVVPEYIQKMVRRQVINEVDSGKVGKNGAAIKKRFQALYKFKYEQALEEKRQARAMVDEVFFIANRSDEVLEIGNDYLLAGEPLTDLELADFEQYGYMLENLLDKCTQPLVKAHEAVCEKQDNTLRDQILEDCARLKHEIEAIAAELGLNWDKVKANAKSVDNMIDEALSSDVDPDALMDEAMTEVDVEPADAEPAPIPARHSLAYDERMAEIAAAEAARKQQDADAAKRSLAAKKAAQTRAAKRTTATT